MHQHSTVLSCLIVDHQPPLAQLFRRILESQGYQVDTALDLQTARHLASHNTYEVALVDLNLTTEAEWEGLAVVEILRDRNPAAKILLQTAETSPAIEREAYRSGANACVIKPCDLAVIDQALHSA